MRSPANAPPPTGSSDTPVAFKGVGRIRATHITESLSPAPWSLPGGVTLNPGPSERVVSAHAVISQGIDEADRSRNRYTRIDGG